MDVYKRKEKMVALTYFTSSSFRWRSNITLLSFCGGSIYIHNILMLTPKNQNILIGISLALVILFLILEKEILLFLLIIILLGLVLKLNFLNYVAQKWKLFISYLGTLLSNTILTIIFYLIISPYSFIYRLFNKNNFNHFFKKTNKNSYYIKTNINYTSSFFKKLW